MKGDVLIATIHLQGLLRGGGGSWRRKREGRGILSVALILGLNLILDLTLKGNGPQVSAGEMGGGGPGLLRSHLLLVKESHIFSQPLTIA